MSRSTISLAPYLSKWPRTSAFLRSIGQGYLNLAGYRKMGLRYDDLLIEENPSMQKALSRLNPREAYDRVYRIRVAHQLSLSHQILPKDKWTPANEDRRYLTPIVEEVLAADKEREEMESLQLRRPKKSNN